MDSSSGMNTMKKMRKRTSGSKKRTARIKRLKAQSGKVKGAKQQLARERLKRRGRGDEKKNNRLIARIRQGEVLPVKAPPGVPPVNRHGVLYTETKATAPNPSKTAAPTQKSPVQRPPPKCVARPTSANLPPSKTRASPSGLLPKPILGGMASMPQARQGGSENKGKSKGKGKYKGKDKGPGAPKPRETPWSVHESWRPSVLI